MSAIRGATPSRRSVLAGVGALGVTPFVPNIVYAQAAVPELTTLRSTSKSWLWAAEDYGTAGGFFAQAGVKVVSNASNRGTNIAALQGGGVDIVLGDPGEPIRAKSQNLQIKTFIATVSRYASHVVLKKNVLAKAGVTEASAPDAKIAALKGLRLGTTGPGAAPDALLRYLSDLGKLDADGDLRLVPIQGGGPGMLAALEQNAIDGFCLSSPTADLAIQKQGCDYLFQMATNPPPQMAEHWYIGASTHEQTLKTKRDALVRYCKGISLALKSISEDQEKFKAWAKVWFEGMDPALFETAFANNGKIYFADPTPRKDLFDKNLAFIGIVNKSMKADPLPPSVTFESLVDGSLVKDALA
jgi:NitT/TauT family transport system substrate-binding protein